jgi:hypothetical protein
MNPLFFPIFRVATLTLEPHLALTSQPFLLLLFSAPVSTSCRSVLSLGERQRHGLNSRIRRARIVVSDIELTDLAVARSRSCVLM